MARCVSFSTVFALSVVEFHPNLGISTELKTVAVDLIRLPLSSYIFNIPVSSWFDVFTF